MSTTDSPSTPLNDTRPSYIVTYATVPSPRVGTEGHKVLQAHLSYLQTLPAAYRARSPLVHATAPTSRQLRRKYAPTMSRADFARGVRQLIALGVLDPTPTALVLHLPGDAETVATSTDNARGGRHE